MLLLTFDYAPEAREGPPFPVPEANVHALYGASFAITQLDRRPLPVEALGVPAHHEAWRLVRR
jgi:thiopurine S-methyltransferase